MKPKAYIETTIVSYLAASPSRDIVIAGHQQITTEWWERRDRFELFVSEAVVEEAMRGDAVVVARRAALLSGIPVLYLAPEVHELANRLVLVRAVPAKALVTRFTSPWPPSIVWTTCCRGTAGISRTRRFVARSNRLAEPRDCRRR